ncbi:hypothetical protein DSO57_1026005 [Entomophthora muscae]|uniref:Uncharacterized protein n=1 Tax=Entomophthora muscae TaxID=34485 RepID=A0ACC2RTC6_9FUNG|nr:hypothetical protein DSO57_1026005 [Entomophthora muscae]
MAKPKHKHQTWSQASRQHKSSSSEEEIIEGLIIPDSWEEQTDTHETEEMETEATLPAPPNTATNTPTETSLILTKQPPPLAEEIYLLAPTDKLQVPAIADHKVDQVACKTQKEPPPSFPKPQ